MKRSLLIVLLTCSLGLNLAIGYQRDQNQQSLQRFVNHQKYVLREEQEELAREKHHEEVALEWAVLTDKTSGLAWTYYVKNHYR